MIQEIAPLKLDNQYQRRCELGEGAKICVFRGNEVLVSILGNELRLPDWAQMKRAIARSVYLFRIGETPYFLCELTEGAALPEGFGFDGVRGHRRMRPKETVFAEMTAWHLYGWYRDNRFCGRCGAPTAHDESLRMLRCPKCGNQIFPKICPAIIAAVIDGDRILLTKYSGRAYRHYALIAGFTEIGETSEETVAREVFEEAGVRVKHIRYWKSQPWGMDSDQLTGYFCDLDGDPTITMDAEELSSAVWIARADLDIPADDISLTNDMIRAFIENRVPD